LQREIMRTFAILLGLFGAAAACAGSKSNSGFDDDGGTGSSGTSGGTSGTSGGTSGGSSGTFAGDGGNPAPPDGSVSVATTIYAHTDDTLYTMDPSTLAITSVGKFAGNAASITDLAVNAAGEVYANSETAIYKAAIPASPGPVNVTQIATIAAKNGQRFFALAFAPAGVLGSGEALVGGDGTGELWSIDPASGATVHLGSFGNDPKVTGNVLGLSGDIVFYTDAANKPTGLATVRSCKAGGTSCSKTSDYLVGIDMTALAAAFTSGTPAATLLSGIYGGSVGNPGPGTGFGEVFGLGAWQGDVFGFTRGTTPQLIQIDTTTGKGTAKGSAFTFTNGWSGAGVTTKVTINVPPPPPVR
jgi:hypothetical protein